MKQQSKNLITTLLLVLINTIISFFITYILGIQNIIIFRTTFFLFDSITYEILIFLGLTFIEGCICEIRNSKMIS